MDEWGGRVGGEGGVGSSAGRPLLGGRVSALDIPVSGRPEAAELSRAEGFPRAQGPFPPQPPSDSLGAFAGLRHPGLCSVSNHVRTRALLK